MFESWKVPRCPLCGRKMRRKGNGLRELAIEEPNRLLTLDEVKGSSVIWLEQWSDSHRYTISVAALLDGVKNNGDCIKLLVRGIPGKGVFLSKETRTFNKEWRCWLREPTSKEMGAMQWRWKK